MKLDRKQDLNILYQVCICRVDRKNKMAVLADFSKRLHIVLRCTICGPLGILFVPNLKLPVFGPQKVRENLSLFKQYFRMQSIANLPQFSDDK